MKWVSVDDDLPGCPYEVDQQDDDDFIGFVSQSVEISDGYNLARGHLRSDGRWIVYGAEHDFQIVDPLKITHWSPMIKPPWLAEVE